MEQRVWITNETMASLAAAIRSKTGLSSAMTPSEMVSNINTIDTRDPIVLTINQNGGYYPPSGKYYSEIIVSVPQSTVIPDVNDLIDFRSISF